MSDIENDFEDDFECDIDSELEEILNEIDEEAGIFNEESPYRKTDEYKKEIYAKIEKSKGKAKKVGDIVVKLSKEGYYNNTYKQDLREVLFKNVKSFDDVLKNGLKDFFEITLSENMAKNFCEFIKRLPLYPYEKGYSRRSYRSEEPEDFFNALLNIVMAVFFKFEEFDLYYYLTSAESRVNTYMKPSSFIIEELLALAIDNDEKKIIEAIKNIILSENNVNAIDYVIIRGIAKSQNKELYELMKNLLIAAKLQEGLRQSIFETADDGRIEYFKMILDTTDKEDFVRFSSCLRAVNTWMGLGYDYENKRSVKKILSLANKYINDKSLREKALDSKDVIEMYVAMWAESAYSINNVQRFIYKYMDGEKYQKIISLYMLHVSKNNAVKEEISIKYLDEVDMDIFTLLVLNLDFGFPYYSNHEDFEKSCKNKLQNKSKKDIDKIYNILSSKISKLPKEGYVLSEVPLDWMYRYSTTKDNLIKIIFPIVFVSKDEDKIKFLVENSNDADSQIRSKIIKFILDPKNELHREYLSNYLGDRSIQVRKDALLVFKDLELNKNDIDKLKDLLKLKTGEIRQAVLEILDKVETSKKETIIGELLKSKVENVRLGGLDLLLKDVKSDLVSKKQAKKIISLSNIATQREKILIEEILSNDEEFNLENGFGLYNPDYRPTLNENFSETKTIDEFKNISISRLKSIVESLVKLVDKNKDYTYKIKMWDDSELEVILGTRRSLDLKLETPKDNDYEKTIFDNILAETWIEWKEVNKVNLMELAKIKYILELLNYRNIYEPNYVPEFIDKIKDTFGYDGFEDFGIFLSKVKYSELAKSILSKLFIHEDSRQKFALGYNIISDIVSRFDEKNFTDEVLLISKNYYNPNPNRNFAEGKEFSFFLNLVSYCNKNDEDFKNSVSMGYYVGKISGLQFYGLDELDIARAYYLGLLEKNELFRVFFRQDPEAKMRKYTGTLYKVQKEALAKYPVLKEITNTVVDRVIEIEVKRGDSVTLVSKMAKSICGHKGYKKFVEILLALGDDTFVRGYNYSGSYTKKDVLSSLLNCSSPDDGADAKLLKKYIDGRIPDRKLLEAAMYSPAWLSIIGDYLGWKGIKSAAWYFHAHTSESFSNAFESEVAKFSPISKEDFQDGAFDINWFKDAYKTLGKERFDILYDCAKYISGGATHRRAQLFSDAVLGKLDLKELEKDISEKRNKEKLLSYSLVPLGKNKEKDALQRFEFIQTFLKESKKFGAQRRESESKVCKIALDNLARNLGYDDATVFSWKMDTLKIDSIKEYFLPKAVENAEAHINIDEVGSAEIVIQKAGKTLKSIPSNLKKNEYIEELKKTKTSLKNQYTRAKASLEKSMESCYEFNFELLSDLLKHPVISVLIKKIVFVSNDGFGFINAKGLLSADGTQINLAKKDKIKIAHPLDFYKSNVWSEYQKFIFIEQIIQPFKQVFRELYIINEDEKNEKTISRRYAGNQIQPRKTVALLKTRGWTVDYESGLQKVYFGENIIAKIYALADWFSPSEVEAPTIETVEFFDRKTGKNLEFEKISPIIFSEVMRDVDLVVSVAHVGGVDPEASHSTIEMRSVIVKEVLSLMKIENVQIISNYAKIKGAFGEYSVHLGSGSTQMMGKGSLNILPVHSQHRGRLFLPFLDEDPKTAEIISKIVLLAEDEKIKDPTINYQIRG